MNITVVYPYYMNNDMFNLHIAEWNKYSLEAKNQINFIVVDDGSPLPLTSKNLIPNWSRIPNGYEKRTIEKGFVNLEDCKVNLSIYRICEDVGYNLSGAKNLGSLLAKTEWIFLCDFDYLLPSESAERLVKFDFKPGHIYFPMWIKTNGKADTKHENNFIVEKWEFWKNHGYDEDFAGFYAYEETYFVSNILCNNLTRINTPDIWTVWYNDDIVPGTEWPRSKKDFRRNHDLCYAKLKHNIPHSNRCLRFSWELVFNHRIAYDKRT